MKKGALPPCLGMAILLPMVSIGHAFGAQHVIFPLLI